MLRSSISAIAIVLLLSAPVHAREIRDTKDCQAAERVQDGFVDLGFESVLDEALSGNYDNYTKWKKDRLQPTLERFEQQFPLKPAEAITLPNYANFVSDYSFRIEQMANQLHQMQRYAEGSKRYEDARKTAREHLSAMKITAAKFRTDCIL